MKNLIFTTFFLLVCLISVGQRYAKTSDNETVILYDDNTWEYADSIPLYFTKPLNIQQLELPRPVKKEILIGHKAYTLSYNKKYGQANWVAYQLTKSETNKVVDRTDNFIADPKIKEKMADDKDYSGSGYDRGHLAPAADMSWDATAMNESFYYSNMSPQVPGFNRGIWKNLESTVRNWAIEYDTIYIVTGPILNDDLSTIGSHKISVPKYFYKVILDYSYPGLKAIGFILPNESSDRKLQDFAITVDSVEKVTGFDFFPDLPDEQENLLESTVNIKDWDWKQNKDRKESSHSNSVQCKGTTKKGERCKNMTTNPSGYCYLHENQNDENKNIEEKSETKTTETKQENSGSYSGSRTIQTGPRGGKYYINSSGKKVYVKKK